MADAPKKFTLTHNFTEFAKCSNDFGSQEDHYNVIWQLNVRNPESDNYHRGVLLYCHKKNESNIWSIKASMIFTVKSGSFENKIQCNSVIFNSKCSAAGQYFKVGEKLLEQLAEDGAATVTCEVTIEKMVGIRQKRKMNFAEADGKMTDVVLVVEEKKFHVSKVMLANFSPVFRSMFFGPSCECEDTEVVIKDVSEKILETLLASIYSFNPVVNKDNVRDLLKLAVRYEVSTVVTKCEDFLIITNEFLTTQKLDLAFEFSLPGLHTASLSLLKNAQDIKNLQVNTDNISEATAKALLKKFISFPTNRYY